MSKVGKKQVWGKWNEMVSCSYDDERGFYAKARLFSGGA